MMKKSIKSNVINILTTAALTLPGVQANADSPIQGTRSAIGYTRYDESGERYKIDVYQAQISSGLSEKWQLDVSMGRDLMTGASSVGIFPQALYYLGIFPNPVDPSSLISSSSASIVDKREYLDATASYFFTEAVLAIGAGYSTENDYQSKTLSTQLRQPFNNKNTELTLGFSYSFDHVEPINTKNPAELSRNFPDNRGDKDTYKVTAGLRQDLSRKTSVQAVIGFKKDKGFLSDPYKVVTIHGDATALRTGALFIPGFFLGNAIPAGVSFEHDKRPNKRDQWSYLGRLVHHIEKTNSSLHLDYRYATTTWDYDSHMIEMSWYQPISHGWEIVPTARYYSQSEARFYGAAFDAVGGSPFYAVPLPAAIESSSDYRLARYGVVSLQLEISKQFLSMFKVAALAGMNNRREHYYWGGAPAFSRPENNYNTTYFGINLTTDFVA